MKKITLREYLEARLADKELRDEQRFLAQEKAIASALTSQDKRLDGMNEFRQTLQDQASSFSSKVVVDEQIKGLSARIDDLTRWRDRGDGARQGLSSGWGYLAGGVGLLIAIAGLASRFM